MSNDRPVKLTSTPPPLPDWLSAVPDNVKPPPPSKENKYLLAEINHLIYSNMFELVLARIAEGDTLGKIMRDCQRGPEINQFMRWVMKDPQRESRFDEAERIATRVMKHEIRDIADGVSETGSELPEDIARSKLRIDSRWKIMSVDNKKRYGETKTIDINQTISITDALRDAQARVATIIDAEVIEPKQLEDDSDA
jgi:hypothetical protein